MNYDKNNIEHVRKRLELVRNELGDLCVDLEMIPILRKECIDLEKRIRELEYQGK